jgi:hypothetical protein
MYHKQWHQPEICVTIAKSSHHIYFGVVVGKAFGSALQRCRAVADTRCTVDQFQFDRVV